MSLTSHSPGSSTFIKADVSLSFDEVYREHWTLLCRIGDRITGNAVITEDLVQEVFVSFLGKYQAMQIDNVSAFLVQAMRYQCFWWLRTAKNVQKHLLLLEKLEAENTTENDLDLKILSERIEEIVSDMPDRPREVFKLSRFENLSTPEIATKLGIAQGTVENHLGRALHLLKLSLKAAFIFCFFQ